MKNKQVTLSLQKGPNWVTVNSEEKKILIKPPLFSVFCTHNITI